MKLGQPLDAIPVLAQQMPLLLTVAMTVSFLELRRLTAAVTLTMDFRADIVA